jgi:glutathione synthase/RimK-type ligase-like ATP-grasp enzyme
MRPVIVTSTTMSVSAKKLATELGGICVLRSSKTFKPKWNDLVINWGCSKEPNFVYNAVNSLNSFESVAIATNKLETFKRFKSNFIPHPEWITDYNTAKNWKGLIVSRSILNGFGGNGITLSESDALSNNQLLYVKYVKKRHEYRVHVFNGFVIDVTWKRKKKGVGHDSKIRNYKNGWVYCRDNLTEPVDLRLTALRAISSLGLNFGAVDIIWNEKQNKCYALEVNTAPGLVGTTLNSYVKAIKDGYY